MDRSLIMMSVMVSAAFPSLGAVLASDDFSYPEGSLTNQAAWTTHSGTSGDLLVASGQAVIRHATATEDAHLDFADHSAGEIYFGLDFSVDDLGAPWSGATTAYFAHFRDGNTHLARLEITAPSGSGDFSVGLATFDETPAIWTSDLDFQTTYRAVVAYIFESDQARLWINPATPAGPHITGAAGTATRTVTTFALRQSDSTEDETVRIDHLVLGTSFGAVVPEPSASLLAGLAGLALLLLSRRRQASHPAE